MTSLGWLIMGVALVSVIGLTVFCLWRVFMLPPVEISDLHAPLEIETPDLRDPD
jgi:hypothetical protein